MLKVTCYWLPVIVWAAFIFYLSSIPDLRSSLPDMWDLVMRKFAHAAEYAVLAVLILRAILSTSQKSPKKSLVIVIVIVALYAISDELHQLFVEGRVAAPFDVLIDTAGGTIGLFLFLQLKKHP